MSKKKPIKEKDLHKGCMNCSTASLKAPMEMMIAVGFGAAYVTKEGKQIYDGESDLQDNGIAKTVAEIEKMAELEPDADWRIIKEGPLHGETYQRQGKENWVCIESNKGFA